MRGYILNSSASLQQQIGQMIISGFHGTTITPETEDLIRNRNIGGLILFGRNFESPNQLYHLIKDLQSLALSSNPEWPLFISVDQEGGRVARLKSPFTDYPPLCCLGEAQSESLTIRFAKALAIELLEVGINMDYAPVLDVHTNPKNPVIGDRAFSSSPYETAKLGNAFIQGFRQAGIIPVGKHFPGHGDTHLDSHLDLPYVNRSKEVLENVELIPFKETIEKGLDVLMTAHVVYSQWDEENPATFSKTILQNILRKQLGFKGIIISDDLEMKAVEKYFPLDSIPRLGLEAGLDIFLVCHNLDKVKELQDLIVKSVDAGKVTHKRIEESLTRILKVKNNMAVLPPTPPQPQKWKESHQKLAEEMRTHLSKLPLS